jgi:hypothetical protein
MKNSTIATHFADAADALYEAPEHLSPEARRELFELEEALSACLYYGQNAGNSLPPELEDRVARLADEIRAESPTAFLDPAQGSDEIAALVRAAALQTYLDSRVMQESPVPAEAVPPVLGMVIDRYFDAGLRSARRTDSAPAIVLQISEGLRVIKSALQGFTLQTESLIATRNAVAAPEARKSHFVLKQALIDGCEIEYQILSESSEAVTLVVSLPAAYKKTRVDLRCEGRMLDSRMLGADGRLSFEHLKAGSYELEFSGALLHICPIQVQG